MDRTNLLNPTAYFGLACVAFSFVAATAVWRNGNAQAQPIPVGAEKRREKHVASKAPSSPARPKPRRRVAVDSMYCKPGDAAYEAIQETIRVPEMRLPPTLVLAELLQTASRLSSSLRSRSQTGESRITTTSLIGELSVLTTSLCRLQQHIYNNESTFTSGIAQQTCLDTTAGSLGETFAMLEAELCVPGDGEVAMTAALQQMRDQRPALDFLLENANYVQLPPTPPAEKATDGLWESSEDTLQAEQSFQFPTGLTPAVDAKGWIEPPPEYSPPAPGSLAAEIQEKGTDSKTDEAPPPEEQPQAVSEEYTIDVLYNAVTDNDVDLVSDLLQQHGANPNESMGALSRTPLHQAAHLNHVSCIGVLLKHGAIMSTEDIKGDTAVHLAAWAGHVEALATLLSHGQDEETVDWLSGRDGYSPLWCAISAYHIDAARLLLRHGARVSLRSTSGGGLMPLHQAAVTGQSAMCELLLDRGAQVDSIDEEKNTALHYASASGSLPSVKILLRNGASAESQQKQGLTPLHWAAHKGHTDVLAMLIAYCGGSIDSSFPLTEGGATPLHLAANRGHLSVARLLLEKSTAGKELLVAEAQWDGVEGTPAEMAEAKGHDRVARFLKGSSKSAV